MPQPSEHEIEVFNIALELPTGERAAYLDRECAGDAALRQRVEELLKANEVSCACLESSATVSPGPGGTVRLSFVPAQKPGDRIGRYKLLQQIGEGGCGVVYMAEQEEPVRRRVALKVIKLGMDTKNVIARFEAERQALALMDHPNIAKVLDAGATDTGRPYFVMELVRGVKITDYCDENRLATAERLSLFIQVCQAIQHAHQKGVIHRDIKPSNILVTVNDGVAVPKVIDFGIAKATQGRLTDQTLFTAFEQFLGTPAYMSPEQAVMTSLDIDTRSDIYSLGVLLYEFLTGSTPFDTQELLRAGLDEMRRTIRENEPPKPSTRLSGMKKEELTTAARHRRIEPPKLIHTVRGDLDWIVMKCLEKDRTRRYESANGLARDLQRHLTSEPVSARPAGNLYRFRKLVRRNKLAFAALTSITIALAAGLGVSLWLLAGERRANKATVQARKEATAEALKSGQIAHFLETMLEGVRPGVARGQDTAMLRGILDQAAERVVGDLKGQPEAEAALCTIIGRAYHELGVNNKSEIMRLRALQLRRQLSSGDSPELSDALNDLGMVLWALGRLPEAEQDIRQALEMKKRWFGNESGTVAEMINNLGLVFNAQAKTAEAEAAFREAIALYRKTPDDWTPGLGMSLMNLGAVLRTQRRYSEAQSALSEAITMLRRVLASDHPDLVLPLEHQAGLFADTGQLAEAEKVYREAFAICRRSLNKIPSRVTRCAEELSSVLVREGKPAEAEQVLREAIQTSAGTLQSPLVLRSLADSLARHGLWQQASATAREALELDPGDHMHFHTLAPLLFAAGDLEGYHRLCDRIFNQFGNTHNVFVADRMAKDCLIVAGPAAACASAGELAEIAVRRGTNQAELAYFQCTKALAEYRMGNFPSAALWSQQSLDNPQYAGDPNRFAEAYATLAMARSRSGQPKEAKAALAQAESIAQTKMAALERGDIGSDWRDWVIAHALIKEAQALLQPSSN